MPRLPSRRPRSFVQVEKEREEIIRDFEVMLDKCYFWQISKKKEIRQRLRFLNDGMKIIREEAESERIQQKVW